MTSLIKVCYGPKIHKVSHELKYINCPPCAATSSSAPHRSIRLREVWHELIVDILEEDLAGEVISSLLVAGGGNQARGQEARGWRRNQARSCLEQGSWVSAWRQKVAEVNVLINLYQILAFLFRKKI